MAACRTCQTSELGIDDVARNWSLVLRTVSPVSMLALDSGTAMVTRPFLTSLTGREAGWISTVPLR